MSALKAVIFDVDGTLVDSQGDILSSMQAAFDFAGRAMPARGEILTRVGLSLDVIFAQLAAGVREDVRARMVQVYKDSYANLRRTKGSRASSPLYPGIRAALETLHGVDEVLLGVATGKSRRGLAALLDGHDLTSLFLTRQVADDHPSKPDPAMLKAALDDLGVAASDAVMIGDTTFDLQMSRSAGCAFIGVTWGYHAPAALAEADALVHDASALPGAAMSILNRGS